MTGGRRSTDGELAASDWKKDVIAQADVVVRPLAVMAKACLGHLRYGGGRSMAGTAPGHDARQPCIRLTPAGRCQSEAECGPNPRNPALGIGVPPSLANNFGVATILGATGAGRAVATRCLAGTPFA
jgi:hypothetical protein